MLSIERVYVRVAGVQNLLESVGGQSMADIMPIGYQQ